MELHPLLRRQLSRTGLEGHTEAPPPDPRWTDLLSRVSRAYEEHDQERYLLERSQALASKETEDLYVALRAERDALEQRVVERTAALRRSENRLQSLLSLSADWVWEQDAEMRFTFLSDGVEKVAGIPASSMIGRKRAADEGFEAADGEWASYSQAVMARRPFRDFSYRFVNPVGELRYIRISGVPVFSDEGSFEGYRGIGRDMTESAMAAQRIEQLAHFDTLTGLPNRVHFMRELETALGSAARQGSTAAVYFLDLDRFKAINDSLGHAAGDELLKTIARRLRGSVRDTDLVARLGGDEFVLLIRGVSAEDDLGQIAGKLLGALASPVTIHGKQFEVTGSIGVARYPGDATDGATLLKHADAAMYRAKALGRNLVHFYTADIAERVGREFELEAALRMAIARRELFLHYQPKYRTDDRRLTGLEALLRWRHPTLGAISPGEFIPIAEERGLIVDIGRWVIGEALQQLARWRATGVDVPSVAVNLSARQLNDPALLACIEKHLSANGLQPNDLELELTESVLMTDPERSERLLGQLVTLGVQVTIDDFGTGYSSLSYLKRFPATCVKIDRAFVSGVATDPDDRAITQAIIGMAGSLGLRVVAEGVETPDQLRTLGQFGCDEVQGFLTGRPAAASDLGDRLRAPNAVATEPSDRLDGAITGSQPVPAS